MRNDFREASDDGDRWSDSLYGRMLLEDVRLGVMPIGGRTTYAARFRVQLAAGSAASVKAVMETLVSPSSHHARDLAHAVSDWIPDCAAATLMYGQVEYELIGGTEAHTVIRRKTPHHLLEPEVRGTVKAQVTCTLASEYTGQLLALRRTLSVVSDPLITGKLFGYFDKAETPRVPFEYDVFRREEAHVLARATAFLGWNARGTFHPEHGQNAYHFVYRELKFHAFKAMLRTQALLCLNECLQLHGKRTGLSMGVEVVGLPTEDDVTEAMVELAEGRTSFSELLARFKI